MDKISWPPDKVTVEQFAGRVRQHLGGAGYIFTPEVGYEYLIADGKLYRMPTKNVVMTVEEAVQMDAETLVHRCKG